LPSVLLEDSPYDVVDRLLHKLHARMFDLRLPRGRRGRGSVSFLSSSCNMSSIFGMQEPQPPPPCIVVTSSTVLRLFSRITCG
jgi:hypothetical protein